MVCFDWLPPWQRDYPGPIRGQHLSVSLSARRHVLRSCKLFFPQRYISTHNDTAVGLVASHRWSAVSRDQTSANERAGNCHVLMCSVVMATTRGM